MSLARISCGVATTRMLASSTIASSSSSIRRDLRYGASPANSSCGPQQCFRCSSTSSEEASTSGNPDWQRPDLHVVLVHPQIPQNSGNVARTCAATAVGLHLVEPLGFELDDKKLKRAGLDYWPHVHVNTHASWKAFFNHFCSLPDPKRLVAYTVYGDTFYGAPEFQYQKGDWLVFGSETSGLPPEAHEDIKASGGRLVKIPINDTYVRSINLAVAAGVGVFEALRQIDSGSHEVQPRPY